MKNDETKEAKKPYQKPEITIVDLAADEVLATGCKSTATTAAPGGPVICLADGCAGLGS